MIVLLWAGSVAQFRTILHHRYMRFHIPGGQTTAPNDLSPLLSLWQNTRTPACVTKLHVLDLSKKIKKIHQGGRAGSTDINKIVGSIFLKSP
jgi:hypothetical protein